MDDDDYGNDYPDIERDEDYPLDDDDDDEEYELPVVAGAATQHYTYTGDQGLEYIRARSNIDTAVGPIIKEAYRLADRRIGMDGVCEYGFIDHDMKVYYGSNPCHSGLYYFPGNTRIMYNFIYNLWDDGPVVHMKFIDWIYSEDSPWRKCFRNSSMSVVDNAYCFTLSDKNVKTQLIMSFFKAGRIYTEQTQAHQYFFNRLLDNDKIHVGVAFFFMQCFQPNEDGTMRYRPGWHGSLLESPTKFDLINLISATPDIRDSPEFKRSRRYRGVDRIWEKGKIHQRTPDYNIYLKTKYEDILEPETKIKTRFGNTVHKGGLCSADTLEKLAIEESKLWLKST